jgi:hypothetical protein
LFVCIYLIYQVLISETFSSLNIVSNSSITTLLTENESCIYRVPEKMKHPRHNILTYLTEGNDRIRDTAGNNCKVVPNRMQDAVAPFLVTTIGLYGYESNNGIRGYVATGELALEVSRRQLVSGVRRDQSSK